MSKAEAEVLKEEGNALFVKNEFALAAQKYSDAILIDKQNAILYANRAACLISLDKSVVCVLIRIIEQ
jgi:Flp pilus assembly protein TadD